MKRDFSAFLLDMIQESENIIRFTNNVSRESFLENLMMRNAVIRSLEVIGEASKKNPGDIKKEYSIVPWKSISGMRDKGGSKNY